MLPILARTAGGTLMRQGGKTAASKILGRKTKMQPGKGQETSGERGALAVRPQTAMVPSYTAAQEQDTPAPGVTPSTSTDPLESINNTLIEIKSILRGTLAAEKKEQDDKEKAAKREDRKRQEQKLETKQKVKGKTKVKMPKAPRMGILSWITNFITTILLGYFAVRMVEFVPFLTGILKAVLAVGEFLTDVGIGLIDAFATFVDIGYKAYDFTRGALKDLGGEDLVSVFDGVMKAVDTVFTLLTVAMLANSMGLTGPKVTPKPKIKPKPGQGLRPKVTKSGGGPANRPDIRNPLRQQPKVTTTGGRTTGKPDIRNPFRQRPQVTTSGTRPGFRFSNPFKGIKGINPKDFATGAASAGIGVLLNLLLDYGFSLLDAKQIEDQARKYREATPEKRKQVREKYTKLAEQYNERSQSLFNKITTVGGLLGPSTDEQLARKFEGALAAFDVVDANPTQEFNEGGKVKPVRRSFSATTIKKQKKGRRQKPTYERITLPNSGVIKIDDDNESPWWDFLGLFGGDELGAGGLRLAQRAADVGNAFGENKYFGPILSVASKFILGQKPDEKDYRNVGYGLNLLIGEGIDDKKIRQGMQAFAEGGMVQTAMSGVDISKWVSDTFRKDISDAINRNYEMGTSETNRKISKEESKEKREQEEGSTAGPGTAAGGRDTATGMLTSLGSGGGSLKDMSDQDFSDLAFIVSAEAARGTDDEYGVAAAVLNRVADPRFPNTIMDVGTAPGQFEAVYKGLAVRDEELAKKLKDNQDKIVEALKELQGRTDFKGQSQLDNMGDTDIMFDPKGNFYHYLEQVGKTDPVPGSVPQDWKKLLGEPTGEQFTPSSLSSSSAPEPAEKTIIKGANISGSDIVSIGKDLGSKGFAIAEHPDFTKTTSGGRYTPGKGSVSSVHKGRGHYEGRAIDVTQHAGGDPEYKQTYLPVLDSLANNPAIKMLIHDTWGFYKDGKKSGPGSHGHPTHMHIEVKDKGGFIGKGLFANLGDTEFVMDADSSEALKKVAPGLQLALNQAKDAKGVEGALQQYAPYEHGAQQTVVVPQPAPPQPPAPQYGSSSMMNIMSAGRSENFSEFLDFQG